MFHLNSDTNKWDEEKTTTLNFNNGFREQECRRWATLDIGSTSYLIPIQKRNAFGRWKTKLACEGKYVRHHSNWAHIRFCLRWFRCYWLALKHVLCIWLMLMLLKTMDKRYSLPQYWCFENRLTPLKNERLQKQIYFPSMRFSISMKTESQAMKENRYWN